MDEKVRPPYVLTVGAIVTRDQQVLLVKHNYGATKGKWDFIRGYVEPTENIQEAIIREVREETSIHAEPRSIIGIRNQLVKLANGMTQNDLLTIWLMDYISGEEHADLNEIGSTRFFNVDDVMVMDDVGSWTKEIMGSITKNGSLKPNSFVSRNLPSNIDSWKFYS